MGTRAELEKLVAMVASGSLDPLVGATFPLERAADAFAQLAAGERNGKLVVVPSA
jgi:NADPH:quinone reductase-like Zn-dependent oxidoreductase